MTQKTSVLMFTNIPVQGEKRSLGGATVLSKEILAFLNKENKLHIKQVQIRTLWKTKLQFFDFLTWIIRFPFVVVKHQIISIHATKDMHFFFSPLLIVWLRLFKKKYVYHCFAGNFHKQYSSKNKLHQKIIDHTVLKANTLFFETKEMVSFFSNKTKSNCVWLPNSRKLQNIVGEKSFEKKFVFISRVLPCKGVEEILKASESLPNDYTIDFYGPINNNFYKDNHFENTKVTYCGILKPEEVASTISKYNVMLLPTYCYGEGYPGTIIESLSLGIPVISTNFNAIPEIIEHQKNGLLVPIKDPLALKEAILSITKENYSEFTFQASHSFSNFNSELVFKKFTNCYLNA
jgi:glycosyltransferase involved in cell wall biosynthesis